jgi:hypothetical protein
MLRPVRHFALLAALTAGLPLAPPALAQDTGETPSGVPGASAIGEDSTHEAAILAALEQTPDADAIPLRATALHFPAPSGESLVAFVADLPAAAPRLVPAEDDPTTLTQDFTVLAVVQDDSGHTVHTTSRRYVLSWGESSMDDVKVGRVLFAREARLPPGRYTVTIAARDAEDGRMGVARFPLALPANDDTTLRVSSLMIVGHAEPYAGDESSPLVNEGLQLFPNLGDRVVRSAGQPLAFLFTLRPGERPLASATVELLRDGTSVVQSPVALPAPDSTGQMRVLSGLQVGTLEPGDYILRLTVNNAQGFQTRTAPFKLVP